MQYTDFFKSNRFISKAVLEKIETLEILILDRGMLSNFKVLVRIQLAMKIVQQH